MLSQKRIVVKDELPLGTVYSINSGITRTTFDPPYEGSKAHSPVPAHHPIRFLLVQQWDKEVARQLINRLKPQLIKDHLQQYLEPIGSPRSCTAPDRQHFKASKSLARCDAAC